MRTLLSLPVLAAAALFVGCAESPFRLTKRIDPESLIVEIDAHDNLRIAGVTYPNNSLEGKFNEYGLKQPGRPVTLLIDEGTDPKAEAYVREKAKTWTLGPVTVIQRSDLGRTYRTREEPKEKPAEPAPAAAPTPAPTPAPEAKPEAAPAPAVVTIHAVNENTFVVDGREVPAGDLAKVLLEIGAAKPNANVELSRAAGVTNDALYSVYPAVRDAKLGAIKVVRAK